MIFGRSLFGGATSGQILATGFAAVLATAVAAPEVTRPVTVQAAAYAVAAAPATKLLIPQTLASARAAAAGSARVDFAAYGSAVAPASLHSAPSAEFFLVGDAQARFALHGLASKRTRMKTALGWAYASGEAEGQVYEYAHAAVARGTARAVGTTYHVGRTDARPTASAAGRCSLIAGGIGPGRVEALATGECRRAGGAAGQAQASARRLVDAAITSNGVRAFELVGHGDATASAHVSNTVVYQIQSVRAGATAVAGNNLHTKGAKGRGFIGAVARGIALGTQTAVTGVGGGRTSAFARAEYRAALKAGGIGRATGAAKATSFFKTRAAAFARALAASADVHLLVKGQAVQGVAQGRAAAIRTHYPRGGAAASAVVLASIQVNDIVKAPSGRTVAVDGEYRHVQVPDQPRVIYV